MNFTFNIPALVSFIKFLSDQVNFAGFSLTDYARFFMLAWFGLAVVRGIWSYFRNKSGVEAFDAYIADQEQGMRNDAADEIYGRGRW